MSVRPLVIQVDDREKIPYLFPGLFYWRPGRRTEVFAPRVESVRLRYGDMRLKSAPTCGVLERKRSIQEIYTNTQSGGALANKRCANFRRELDRMSQCAYPALLLDFTWDELWLKPGGGLSPYAVLDRLMSLALPRGIGILGPHDARSVRRRQAAGDFILRYLLAARECGTSAREKSPLKVLTGPAAGTILESDGDDDALSSK